MMKLRNLKFALNSAWQSFWRNLAVSLAAVLSITLILILAGVNLLVGHTFSQVVDGFRMKVSEISINVADGTPMSTVYDFQAQLKADPRVADVDLMGRRWSGVDPTDPTNYQGDFVNRMLELSSWLGVAGIGLMVILVVVSIVIVMNTIRTAVYHRRKEIEVMKLVGATEWFVRGPFVIEGIMTGVIAAAIALALLVVAYEPAVQQFKSDVGFIPLSYDPSFISSLARDLLAAGALL